MRGALQSLWVVVALCLCATFAFAQDNTDIETLNAQGLEAFGAGEYQKAADIFARAYGLEPRAELLKNRAIALYRAKNFSGAIAAGKEYIRAYPDASDIPEIEALKNVSMLALAERAIRNGDIDRAEEWLDQVTPSDALIARIDTARTDIEQLKTKRDEERRAALEEALKKEEEERKKRAVVAPPPEPPRAETSVAGWVLVGVGGAAILGGAFYHIYTKVVTEDEFREVGETASSRTRYEQLDQQLKVANIMVPTLYGIGAATAGIGLTLILTRTETETVGGISWRGSF